MAAPDLSALSTGFFELGGPVFGKKVLEWNLRNDGIQIRTNVKAPQKLVKMSATGNVRPYAEADHFGTGVAFTNRTLTVRQTKKDYPFNPEEFRNTLLASLNPNTMDFVPEAVNQVSKEYLNDLMANALYLGVYNGAGTAAADTVTGWGTIIAAEITATNITPVVTGAITNANAVSKVDLVAKSAPLVMRQLGMVVYCSYSTFDKYAEDYRSKYGFQYVPSLTGGYRIDNVNAELKPVAWMGTSNRLIATIPQNLVFGTDIEQIQMHATPHLDILQIRQKMPLGCEIQDLGVLVVNDQA
jgi:hypothetical protein